MRLMKPFSSGPAARFRLTLKLLGILVLVGGFGAAVCIWRAEDLIDRQRIASQRGDSQLSPDDSRRYTHDTEMYYGQTGLLMDRWRRWLDDQTHGKGLARTLAITSLLFAAGCFLLAAAYHPERSLSEGARTNPRTR